MGYHSQLVRLLSEEARSAREQHERALAARRILRGCRCRVDGPTACMECEVGQHDECPRGCGLR